MMVVDIEEGIAKDSFKIKKYCNNANLIITQAIII